MNFAFFTREELGENRSHFSPERGFVKFASHLSPEREGRGEFRPPFFTREALGEMLIKGFLRAF